MTIDARIDTERLNRTGMPEAIYAEGKTLEQVSRIAGHMHDAALLLITRIPQAYAVPLQAQFPDGTFDRFRRTMCRGSLPRTGLRAAIVSAGTSDLQVAEEAAFCLQAFGGETVMVTDVGVAGIHRLFEQIDGIRSADVV